MNTTTDNDELLDAKEVAAYLKIHPNTAMRLAREGRLPGVMIGRAWRFPKQAILDLVYRRESA